MHRGSSRLVSTEGGRATAVLKVLVLVGDVGDVLCPSGRAGFSPNPRAPQQGTPRLLITGPPAGSSTLLTSSVHKHTDHCHKKTSLHTQHQHINRRALGKISLRDRHIPQTSF